VPLVEMIESVARLQKVNRIQIDRSEQVLAVFPSEQSAVSLTDHNSPLD